MYSSSKRRTGVHPRSPAMMEDQDRVSQASSSATVSFLPIRDECHEKVQTFGKRCQAAKRDPNCPVVIRGWLYKRDSTGLKLWKRRWFVLSNYCLYYYKDSREESVLGSIPLPSYRILYCSPRECRNRKYAFKVVHQGMRPYIMSAETQEDMLGWVRALSQSASMEADDIINRRCASFQDFTQMGDNPETMELQHMAMFPERNTQTATKLSRVQTEPTLLDQDMMGIKMKTPELRGRHENRPIAPEATEYSQSFLKADEEPLSFLHSKATFKQPSFPRDQYGSPCHGNMGRADVWPLDNCSSAPMSPCIYTPEFPCSVCYCSNYHTAEHMAMCKAGKSDIVIEREIQPIRDLENDTDVVLTRLCGCDKLLQSVSMQLAQLQADKKSIEYALEIKWLGMEDGLPGEQEVSQKTLLQEELVTLRARICDLSSEMDSLWSDYERMESELSVFHSHLQHILHFGTPQEQIQAQRQLWMMEDILCGLRVNKNRFMALLGLQRQGAPQPKPVSYFEGELGGLSMECVTEAEQQDYMKIHQSYKKWTQESPANDSRMSSEHEASHEPLRLTRVVTSTLPTSLIAERIFVDDPYPEPPEQISLQSGLRNSQRRAAKKPSRTLHETTDKNRHLHWADGPEEMQQKKPAQNHNSSAREKALAERKIWTHRQQELEPGALCLTNSESDCDAAMSSQKRQTKPRQTDKRDRNMSAAREHFIDDIHPLKLITASEKETEKYTADSAVVNLSNGYSGDRRKFKSHSNESANPIKPQCGDAKVHNEFKDKTSQQSSRNDIIVIESHSINHISTLTVFKGHQGNNQMHKPHKKNRSSDRQKYSVSTNVKSECFLSNNRQCELVPVYVHDANPQESFPPVENQQPGQGTNQTLDKPEGGDCGRSQSPKTTFEMAQANGIKEMPNQSPDAQPITSTDNQLTPTSDQSKPEPCIYEEIQFSSPRSADVEENQKNQTSGDETQPSNLTENKPGPSRTESNGEYSTKNTEKSQPGSDVTCKSGKKQKVYSSLIKSSVINHHVQDCRPRITVVSTSL
ncbi:pleckstrin homology domain-containing family A member 4 [Onychostoma macrolepis]|uniref:pleckstrin homology domain-containing family A member 4 n=1 Tax=Onychostoma macrolepis TaxID=369639 RepID=UPI00272B56F9|nr:pleckstrin homology domain-containing family A member 4 [Onychostoma macrolepis]